MHTQLSSYPLVLSLAVLVLAGCATSPQFTRPDCGSLTGLDSATVIVDGLYDHLEMEPAWLLEEIEPDHIDAWIDRNARTQLISGGESPRADSLRIARTRQWLQTEWGQLRRLMQPGDRFFYYSTPDGYWSSLAGQDGIVLIRKCKIVARMIITQS